MSKTPQRQNETKQNKNKNDKIADSQYSRADNSYTVQYNHDSLIIVK